MSAKSIDLVVNVTSKATDAVDGADKVGSAYSKMADKVDHAGAASEKAGRRLAITADGADHLASKSSVATGALGALSAGFELVGLEKYAGGLQAASMATDFFSGVGDSLTLVMESQALATARAKVATVAHAAASKASAAAQWVLNAAMSANPIGLVVLAVVALVAAFVIAYRKSERFRSIVQAAGRAGKAAIGWVVDKIRELVGWVRDKAPRAFTWLKDKAVAAVRLITAPQRVLIRVISSMVTWLRERVPAAFDKVRDKASAIADKLTAPFRALMDLINRIIDAIKSIHLPHLPSFLGGSSRTSLTSSGTTSRTTSLVKSTSLTSSARYGGGGGGGGGDTYRVTVNGALDADKVAKQIDQLLRRRAVRTGRAV